MLLEVMRSHIIHIIVILLFAVIQAHSQNNDYQFRNFTAGFNFSGDNVRCVYQDSKGFIWMGLESEGLCKFDGSKYEVFSENIASNYINDINEDAYGNIWVATENGLNILQQESSRFTNPTGRSDEVFMLFRDQQDKMWVGDATGLFQYSVTKSDSGYNYKQEKHSITEKLKGETVLSFLWEDSVSCWIGTKNGLFYNSPTVFKQWKSSNHKPFALSDNEVHSIVQLDNRDLLLATDNGVNILNHSNLQVQRLEFKNSGVYNNGKVGVVKILKSSDNMIWIGTTTYGILTGKLITSENGVSQSDFKIPEHITGLSSAYITDVMEDQNRQIWVSTKFGGLFIHDRRGQIFRHYELDEQENQSFIISVAEDNEGQIWLGTREAGLVRFNPNQSTYQKVEVFQNGEEVRRIESLFCDSEGKLWIGHKKGINKLDPKTLMSEYFNLPKVISIAEGIDKIWVGTTAGLFTYTKDLDFTRFKSSQVLFDKADVKFSKLLWDNSSTFWLGTNSHGLYQYFIQKDSLSHVNTNDLANATIRELYQDSKSNIWIGTKSSGLYRYEKGDFQYFTIKNGLPSHTIFSVLEDNAGKIWLTTNKGVSRYDPSIEEFRNFNSYHGLQGNVFEKNAAIKLQSGFLLMAGNNGFNLFDPQKINIENFTPPLVINALKANGQLVIKDAFYNQSLQLPYDQNLLSLEFSALDYRDIGALKYKYRLLGLDNQWSEAGNKNTVTYSNLEPGIYSFQVFSTDADGKWTDNLISLEIEIASQPWLSWWAKLLYAIALAAIVFLVYWVIAQRVKYHQKMKLKDMELSHVSEMNDLKINFFTNISHELRTPLTLIMTPLERLLNTYKDESITSHVKMAHASAKKLLNLTDQLIDFTKIEHGAMQLQVQLVKVKEFFDQLIMPYSDYARSRSVDLKVQIFNQEQEALLDVDKVEKVFNNLIINALKYTQSGGEIILTIEADAYNLTFSISDTGKGISQANLQHIFDRYYQVNTLQPGGGIGLELVYNLVSLHKGKIQVESEEGKGSTFTVSLPIGSESYGDDEVKREPGVLKFQGFIEGDFKREYEIEKRELSNEAYKILIVDDNQELLHMLAETFSDKFFLDIAASGEEAWNIILKEAPDIVITDITMANGDGLELCRQVKENVDTNHIPVILLTARSMTDQQLEGFGSGADAYVVKPFDLAILEAQIYSLIENRRRLWKHYNGQSTEIEITENPLDDHFLKKLADVIRKNYTDPDFSVEALAFDLGMSRSQLFRKLKSLTNQTPSEYLYAYRIRKASDLLKEGRLGIAEIAYKTGFSSPNSFTKTFKKHLGISPTKYSKNY
ncbi:hybrid sensor histidine kinase/response regulator transcription factor [Fulvivirga ligni]|uniref:hybrid sensor histidine kinase/response regulator transcription factor n=1 Tax=Fulvivirga ligni TaxID=2904246 RepID=UPI001F3077F5|nr:hybrid sensor histidine kinase/response regulator transcription factor [Fulvivirga ligni]UII23421.1 ATP-binding protein [Fulvivirga ligni]